MARKGVREEGGGRESEREREGEGAKEGDGEGESGRGRERERGKERKREGGRGREREGEGGRGGERERERGGGGGRERGSKEGARGRPPPASDGARQGLTRAPDTQSPFNRGPPFRVFEAAHLFGPEKKSLWSKKKSKKIFLVKTKP